MGPNPDPVWILFRRRTFSRLAYWCQVLGLDLRDRSLNNRFYFVYFCAFWLVWVGVVFAMLGSALTGIFKYLAISSPPDLVILLGAFIMAIWGLTQFWQVTGRSPFVFDEVDAALLCQTPVRRRSVGLAWFLMDWFWTVLAFAAGAILLSYPLAEAALSHAASVRDLPIYFAAILRALMIVLPLQMGLQAGIWGLGALRLRRDKLPSRLPWLRVIILLFGVGLLVALFLPSWRAILLAPLIFPLQAAFSQMLSLSTWLIRAGLTLVILILGITGLMVWSVRMHLGQAAQETRLQSIIQLARSTMNYDLAEIFLRQGRMKATRSPSRLPVRSGTWVLVWKDLVQSWRSLRANQVMRWFRTFFLGLGIFLATGWVVKLIIGTLWAISLGSLVTDRLRNDMARWWLLRSLPVRNSVLLITQLGSACGLGLLLGWLALALTNPPSPYGWLTAALLPFLVTNTALGSARDILVHTKARVLMAPNLAEENVPRQDIQGALIMLVSVGLPLGMMVRGMFYPDGLLWSLLSLPTAALITIWIFKSTLSVYRWIS